MFYMLFRDSNYSRFNDAQRQELLQEVANRSARMDHSGRSAQVVLTDLHDSSLEGEQRGETVYLNTAYFGQAADGHARRSGMQAVETVIHEERHHYQEMAVQGQAPATRTQRLIFESNMGTPIQLPGGKELGLTYASGDGQNLFSDAIYRAQPVESDAFRVSEARTKAIAQRQIDLLAASGTPAPSHSADKAALEQYVRNQQAAGYDAQMRFQSARFGVKNLEQEVQYAFLNNYQGTKLPVAPVVSATVSAEQKHTYEAVYQQSQSLRQGTGQAHSIGYSHSSGPTNSFSAAPSSGPQMSTGSRQSL